ncbi:hypothetical protein T09_15625 [Trichinella sp. T9]|nr:hypothetical protein T09_15625 [Trichinella sp. T9]
MITSEKIQDEPMKDLNTVSQNKHSLSPDNI